MKIFNLLLVLVFSVATANATLFEVAGVREAVLLRKDVPAAGTVGELTDQILSDSLRSGGLTEYTGSSGGVVSVNGLTNAIEVISDREMRAYGWCYWVDGVESGKMADEFVLTGRERSIRWFYAYAHLIENDWVAMCVPADRIPRGDL